MKLCEIFDLKIFIIKFKMKNTAIGMKEISYEMPFCVNKLSSILKSEYDSLSES